MKINNFKRNLICWGAGDQALVLKPIVESLGSQIDVAIDDTPGFQPGFSCGEFLPGVAAFEAWCKGRLLIDYGFIIAIGNPYAKRRLELHDYLVHKGAEPISLCDSSALVDKNVKIQAGVQIMKGAIVNSEAQIGTQVILNTRSLTEHHDILENGVEIGPGAILCGRVHVKKYSWIGAGATVLPRLSIGENTIVGAGSLVNKNIQDNTVVVGNPAQKLRNNE